MSVGIVVGPCDNGDGIWILTSDGIAIQLSFKTALNIAEDIINKIKPYTQKPGE